MIKKNSGRKKREQIGEKEKMKGDKGGGGRRRKMVASYCVYYKGIEQREPLHSRDG